MRAGELLKIADGIYLAPGADDAAAERLRGLPRPFALSQARQALDTTRRIAISMPSAGPPASTARADCLPMPPDGPPCGSTSTRPCGSTSTKPTRRDRVPPSFGQIWTTGYPTHTEVLPNVPHLVVSSDLYNESGLGVLVVEIDSHEMRDPELHELIPGIGTVMLDRLAWYPQNWLREHIGDLPDNRHTELGRLIRNLIRP
ncbi:MAG: hypothetical protein ACRDRU_18225 [Pseudonocardiaceae bacterium]